MNQEVEFRLFGEGLSDPSVAYNIDKLLGLLATTHNFNVERVETNVPMPEEIFEHDPRGFSKDDFTRLYGHSEIDSITKGQISKAFSAARRVASGLGILVNNQDQNSVLVPRSMIEELLDEKSRASEQAYNIGRTSRRFYRQLLASSKPASETEASQTVTP